MSTEPKSRRKWTEPEDEMLQQHVDEYGPSNWKIADQLIGKKKGSCASRWRDYKKPGLKHGKFTHQDKKELLALHSQFSQSPQKWKKMAERFPDRTPNAIKNFYNTHLRHRNPPTMTPPSYIQASTAATRARTTGTLCPPGECDNARTPYIYDEEYDYFYYLSTVFDEPDPTQYQLGAA